jgi:hypothetical protein
VVDDELAIGAEEVQQSDARLFPGSIERSKGIRLRHFDDGQVAALGGKGVAGPREILFLFEEGNASGAVLGRGGDLFERSLACRTLEKKGGREEEGPHARYT